MSKLLLFSSIRKRPNSEARERVAVSSRSIWSVSFTVLIRAKGYLVVPGLKDKRREVRAPSYIHIRLMKRFLLSLVAIIITSVCFAQDIIVQKDGSTIQAKVLKVSQSEVEYKKFSNQNGPTYSISTKDLQCINYQNGTKDTFVSPNYDPTIVTNETATQFSNDQQLMRLYNQENNPLKKAKTLKTTGIVLGSVGLIAGLTAHIYGSSNYRNFDDSDALLIWSIGGSLIAAGAVCYYIGYKKEKKNSLNVQSCPIYQQEFSIGKSNCLMVGVDMLKDNTRKNQTLGLGVSYNF